MHFTIKIRFNLFKTSRFIKFNENDFVNKTKRFEINFRYNLVISNDFIIKINLKTLLIMKRIINLSVDINRRIAISSLNILNNRFIINFKSNAFKTTFDESFLKIKMKLNKLLIFFS